VSNGKYEFLREYDEGEFRVWLGGQIDTITTKIAAHRRAIIGAFLAAFAALASVAGWAVARMF